MVEGTREYDKMKLTIDTRERTLTCDSGDRMVVMPLYSKKAFEQISEQWLKVGWNEKYVYTFTWMGRPIIQLPEDVIRVQEAIYRLRPDVIIETGVAHGGSLVFYASLCQAMGTGRVVGVDIEIRPHNRRAIESHELFHRITLIEGSSTDESVIERVRRLVQPTETVLVLLDSNHTYKHVSAELEAYCDLVTPGSYIVATDGIMRSLHDVPRGSPSWERDNPACAAADFLDRHTEFVLEHPALPFNESALSDPLTHWPNAWLRRR
jgi:cephalosporin hydroxylase